MERGERGWSTRVWVECNSMSGVQFHEWRVPRRSGVARARDERVAGGDERIGWGGCGGNRCPGVARSYSRTLYRPIRANRPGWTWRSSVQASRDSSHRGVTTTTDTAVQSRLKREYLRPASGSRDVPMTTAPPRRPTRSYRANAVSIPQSTTNARKNTPPETRCHWKRGVTGNEVSLETRCH